MIKQVEYLLVVEAQLVPCKYDRLYSQLQSAGNAVDFGDLAIQWKCRMLLFSSQLEDIILGGGHNST